MFFEPGPEIPKCPPEFSHNKKEAIFDLLSEMEDHLDYVTELQGRISRMIDLHMK